MGKRLDCELLSENTSEGSLAHFNLVIMDFSDKFITSNMSRPWRQNTRDIIRGKAVVAFASLQWVHDWLLFTPYWSERHLLASSVNNSQPANDSPVVLSADTLAAE